MKKTLFIILSVLSYKLNAQVQANTNTGNLKVIGALKIEQPVCYSGDIIEGVYSIQNISTTDTIYISQIVSDCICIQYAFNEKGIPPNSTDSIIIFFMTKNTPPGPFFKRIFVDYDDTNLELYMEGNIEVKRPIYKKGEKPQIYKPKQIRLNNPKNNS
jgi:hypothetical protein